MALKVLVCFVALVVTATADYVAPYAAPYQYGASYHPYGNPYAGAVASTSTNIVRSPGNLGHVAAFHKTVETPFSSVHKADVRVTNDIPYHHAPGYQPYAVAATVPFVPHPYPAPLKAYAAAPYAPNAYADPHAYAPVPHAFAAAPHAYAPGPHGYGAAPHAVAHTSYSGPYGVHYSY
ncbi:cuticle protein 67-like [Adelges cooleyi]|uniref:cuticle protein 67-like n=1 Tax=Adelges cooleyi TaxID=133065 RepID=UPI00217F7917|nr:cuticle protein 67-like [Adelges cooleyi]